MRFMDISHGGMNKRERTGRDVSHYNKKACLISVVFLLCGLFPGCGNASRELMAKPANPLEAGQETVSGNGTAQKIAMDVEAADAPGAQEDSAIGPLDEDETVSGNHAEADNPAEDEGAQGQGEDEALEAMRRAPVKVKGIYVSGPVAGIAKMDDLIDLVDQTELNAMVIDIKNDEGKVTYQMQSKQVMEIDAGVGYITDIEGLVAKCKEKDIYLIARIVAFRDPYLAEQKPEWAVHTKDGEIFRDKSGLAWVNPYERGVWDYLAEIALEAGKAGFDEVQFDYIRFSTDIREEEVDYGPEAEKTDKIGIITEFTQYMYDKLIPAGVYVAADVFGTVIDNEIDQEIVGQDYVQMAGHLDYICPMVYPSHYHNGAYGIPVPDADPYRTIYEASSASVRELGTIPQQNRAHVRMWLQSFTASWVPGHIKYGPKQIREQIKGAYFAGYDEWILWNAAVNYRADCLLTEEEAENERLQWEEEKKNAQAVTGESAQPQTVSGNGVSENSL